MSREGLSDWKSIMDEKTQSANNKNQKGGGGKRGGRPNQKSRAQHPAAQHWKRGRFLTSVCLLQGSSAKIWMIYIIWHVNVPCTTVLLGWQIYKCIRNRLREVQKEMTIPLEDKLCWPSTIDFQNLIQNKQKTPSKPNRKIPINCNPRKRPI